MLVMMKHTTPSVEVKITFKGAEMSKLYEGALYLRYNKIQMHV